MIKPNNSISITLKSHLTPSVHIEKFIIGKEFRISTAAGTTLNEFLETMFPHNIDKIGFKIVNGQISFTNIVLAEGDKVEVYTLISGG